MWGEWIKFDGCSLSCGDGYRIKVRTCDRPKPSYGGLACLKSDGSKKRDLQEVGTVKCNIRACQGK